MIANASHLRSHNGRKRIAVSAAAPEAAAERIWRTFAFIKTLLSDVVEFQSIVEYLTRKERDGLIGFSR